MIYLDTPLVTIVVPVYNVEHYLDDCLNSIRQQSYSHLEIIIVEDCSKDNSLDIIHKHLVDKRIKLIQHQKNSGLSAARNTGIDAAKGEFIVFVDSDDLIHSQLIELCVKNAKLYNADLITYQYKAFDDNTETQKKLDTINIKDHDLILKKQDHEYFDQQNFAWLKFIKTEHVKAKKLKFPIGLYYEDWPFHWELGLSTDQKYHLPADLLFYRQRISSITGKADAKLLDLFKVQSIVIDLISNYQAFSLLSKLNYKIKMSHWSILTRIDKQFLYEALVSAKRVNKKIGNQNMEIRSNIRILIISFIIFLPTLLGLNFIRLLRFILKK